VQSMDCNPRPTLDGAMIRPRRGTATGRPEWGLGVEGQLGADAVSGLAEHCEALGYQSFWFNMIGNSQDPIEILAACSERTHSILIGVGVIPLGYFPAGRIISGLANMELDSRRFVLGVGAHGLSDKPLVAVRAALRSIREVAPLTRTAVGGIGPRMLTIAAHEADAVVLSMVSPAKADWVVRHLSENAAGRALPDPYLYHRVAVGPNAVAQLTATMAAHGAWDSATRAPDSEELLGTPAESDNGAIRADLAKYPGQIHSVLRPVPQNPADVTEWHALALRFAPEEGCP